LKITLCLTGTCIAVDFLGQTRQVAPLYDFLFRKFAANGNHARAFLNIEFLPCSSENLPVDDGGPDPYYETLIPNDRVLAWMENPFKRTVGFPIDNRTIAVRLLNGLLLFSPENATGRLFMAKNEKQPFRALYHLLWVFFAQVLGENGGCFLHAAALLKGNRGYVFMGDSGVGKTTLADRTRQCRILSDEGTLVSHTKNYFRVFPSPYNQLDSEIVLGNEDTPEGCRIGGLFFLLRDKENFVEPISRKQALSMILGQYLLFFPFLSPSGRAKLFDSFYVLCDKTLPYNLHFRQNIDLWEVIPAKPAEE